MASDFDKILDECVDRINRGERLENCLASYPEHAEELEPLLRAMLGTQTAYTFTPSPTTKQKARQRFNAALEELVRRRGERRALFPWVLRQSRAWVAVAAVLLVALIGYFGLRPMLFPTGPAPEQGTPSLAGEPTSTPTPTGREANFRLLLSDDASEVTAINEFASVNVTVNKIGFQRGGESGSWIEPEDFKSWTGNLLDLIGANATEIWSGYIDPGDYTKTFIYVDNVTGTLIPKVGGNQVDDIKIPSDKLHIPKPFTVTADGAIVDFVFDITIIKAGKSGQYLVKPQVDESGPDQEYIEVNHEDQDDSTREMKFRGTILTFPSDNWTVRIGNEVRTVNVEAAKIEGTPDEGLKVKIEGTEGENDIIVASEVKVKEAEEEEFEGTIVSISDNWTMEIEGEMWMVDVSEADIEGNPAEELEAEIKGTVVADKTIKASEIEIKETGE